jgi:DNA-directed RNA polymerase specialized sigma24 family protein
MVDKQMKLLADRHSDWVNIVKSFGVSQELAEDITQEMYIKIQLKLEKGLDIAYEDEINYYYIFKTLRTLFLDLMRKRKNIYKVDIEKVNNIKETEQVYYTEKYNLILDELDKMYWYDKKVYLLIDGGESVASLARKTGIPYYSLYNTYKRVRERRKKLL